MILVRRNLKHNQLSKINTNLLECVGVQIQNNSNSSIDIFSIYLPGGATNDAIRKHYINDVRKIVKRRASYFAMGDWNSKHRFWNCNRANLQGTLLYNEYCINNFLIRHPNSHTHHPVDRNKIPSTIDLCLTNGLHRISNPECLQLNSDHNPVLFEIFVSDSVWKNELNLIPSFRNANWDKYKSIIRTKLQPLIQLENITSTSQIDTMIEHLTDVITFSQHKSVPLVPRDSYFVDLTPDIIEDIKIRNTLTKQWQRTRFTFTVKKFLETPLRDHCCDLKGTPRGFQKHIFKKNPYVKIWVFGP